MTLFFLQKVIYYPTKMIENNNLLTRRKRGRKSISEMGRILSFRQEEILLLLKEGKTYSHIEAMLSISETTVKTHAHNIYTALRVKNKIEAVNKYFIKNQTS